MIDSPYQAHRIILPESSREIVLSHSGMQFLNISSSRMTNTSSHKWDNFPLLF